MPFMTEHSASEKKLTRLWGVPEQFDAAITFDTYHGVEPERTAPYEILAR